MTRAQQRVPAALAFSRRAACSNRTRSPSSAIERRRVRPDDSSFTLNTPETGERDMPEAMLPAVVLVWLLGTGASRARDRAGRARRDLSLWAYERAFCLLFG